MKLKETFVFLSVIITACSTRQSIEGLRTEIDSTFSAHQGEFALAFKDLTSGQELLMNEHLMFHAASTMKTPVMIEVYKQADEGRFRLTDSVTVTIEFRSIVDGTFTLSPDDDSEHALYELVGKQTTIADLVNRMISQSSNLATNILIDLVGASNVTQTLRSMGANDIVVLRGVEDGKAYRAGLNNKTSAYDMMLIYEQLALGKVVTESACQQMIDVLSAQEFNTIIPAKLPQGVKVAHKTGWITGLHHDSGIVFLPDGRKYVVVILSHKLEDEKKAIEAMSEVSRKIYEFVNGIK